MSSLNLIMFARLLRDLRDGSSLAFNCLVDAEAPSDLVDPIGKAFELLHDVFDKYIDSLKIVCKSDSNKEC